MFYKVKNNILKLVFFLEGKKTYIVSSLMVLSALYQVQQKQMSLNEFLNSNDLWVLLNGLGLGALRGAVGKL